MNITALFREFHQGFPSSDIAFFDTLDDAHWRTRPSPAVNSLAWLIWHMARVQDAGEQRPSADALRSDAQLWTFLRGKSSLLSDGNP